MKKVIVLLGNLFFWMFSPMLVFASSEYVHPSELSFETLSASDTQSIFSMVYYEDSLLPIVSRSIGRGSDSASTNSVDVLPAYADISQDAKDATVISWLLPTSFGGAMDSKNTILSTTETQKVLNDVLSQVSAYLGIHTELTMDVQVVPVFSATEDIMPEYIFVGFRALGVDGVPQSIPDISTSSELAGIMFIGGSGYQYMAIKNGSVDNMFDYSTGEHSRKEKHNGFDITFNPVDYFGDESISVNDESVEQYTEDNLPPGSSSVFLENNNSGINSMEVGVAQASGESTSSSSNSLILAFLPIIIIGAILLIAMGN